MDKPAKASMNWLIEFQEEATVLLAAIFSYLLLGGIPEWGECYFGEDDGGNDDDLHEDDAKFDV